MIASAILYAFSIIWSGLSSVLPTGVLPAGVTSAIETAISWIWVANPVIDVNAIFLSLSLWFTVEVTLWTAKLFVWVYSKIPIFGKK